MGGRGNKFGKSVVCWDLTHQPYVEGEGEREAPEIVGSRTVAESAGYISIWRFWGVTPWPYVGGRGRERST